MKWPRGCTRANSQLEEPSTGTPRSDAVHQLHLLLIEFFIALSSEVLVLFEFLLREFALERIRFVFEVSACASTWNSAFAVTSASARRLTELATFPALEVGATPPTELASEPSKVTLAIKLNATSLLCYLEIVARCGSLQAGTGPFKGAQTFPAGPLGGDRLWIQE